MSTDILIRRATRADVDRIVRLANHGGPDGKARTELPEVLDDAYFVAFQRIDADPQQLLMVAEHDGGVIGTFQMTYLTYLAAAGREDCQIESVHIAEKWRGHGIGTEMMEWAIDQAQKRGCRRVQLTTNKKRKDAHRFYERLGFKLTHEGAKLDLNPAL